MNKKLIWIFLLVSVLSITAISKQFEIINLKKKINELESQKQDCELKSIEDKWMIEQYRDFIFQEENGLYPFNNEQVKED